jgi:hypothetical protein
MVRRFVAPLIGQAFAARRCALERLLADGTLARRAADQVPKG